MDMKVQLQVSLTKMSCTTILMNHLKFKIVNKRSAAYKEILQQIDDEGIFIPIHMAE